MKKYFEIAKIGIFNRFAYLGDAISRPLFFGLILFVFFQLWRKVFSPENPVVAGFNAQETLWYLVITEAIMLSGPRFQDRVDSEIKSGSIAYVLIRPCDYVLYHISQGFGETLPVFAMNFLVGIVLTILMVGPLNFYFFGFPIVAISIALAFLLNMYIGINIALLAFWVEETAPFFWIYHKMLFIVGGLMIPIDFFPDWLRSVAELLPFRDILCGPAALFVHFTSNSAASLLFRQFSWTIFFAITTRIFFYVGMKRVQIQGG